MSNKINREEFLAALESVQPGLSPRLILEQSVCFVFKDGAVMTYNDEIACRTTSGLDKSFTGAVSADPLLAILHKLNEEVLDLEVGEGEIVLVGKRRKCGIKMEKEILLPIDKVETPKGWKSLPDDFGDAIEIVQPCAGKDENTYVLTCVHIHPRWIEAFDNHQMIRYRCKTGVEKPTLVKRDNIKHVTPLGMTQFSETESWLHFRNPSGLQFACKRLVEDFPDLTPYLSVHGQPTTLPKGLGEAADRAEVFSGEDADHNEVLVQLKPGKLRIKGTGANGWYSEIKNLKYDGAPMEFMIAPVLLQQLVKRYNEVELTKDKLKVDGGKFIYLTSLNQVEEDGKE